MKNWKLITITALLVLACVGCGTKKADPSSPAESAPAEDTQTNEIPTEEETAEKNEDFSDLEEKGESGDVKAFAEQIKSAMADRDLAALSDLCSYPLAVNGEVVENKEAFLALDEDTVFTEERCAVIAAVDESTLEETMAGVIMGDATPNIIFKSVDGDLGITGIN